AVACMKAGAADYVLKDRLARLPAAIEAALERKREKQEVKNKEQFLRRLQKAIETVSLGVTISSLEGTILYTNPAEARMHGYEVEELVGRDAHILSPRSHWKQLPVAEIKELKSWNRESWNIRR